MRKIILQWEGPFSEEQLKEKDNTFNEKGVYQIYGTHPTSGPNTLLYIGQTLTSFRQRLKEEIKSNNNWYAKTGSPMNFYLSAACSVIGNKCIHSQCEGEKLVEGCREFKETDINTVEKLLINAHMPPCNSQNLTIKVNDKKIDESILIWNRGYYKSLLPELSSDFYGLSKDQ